LFAQRLGVQVGARRTALNLPGGKAQVSLGNPGVFEFNHDVTKNQVDAELPNLHQRSVTLKPPAPPENFPLVVRVMFNHDAADADGLVRVSPAAVRLVANGVNCWPVGTVERGQTVYAHKMDDFLLIDVKSKDHGADFLFFVDPTNVLAGNPKEKDRKVQDGVFLEVKRLSQIDLGGKTVAPTVTRSADVEVMRKAGVKEKDKKTGAAEANPSLAPFTVSDVKISDKLFSNVNVGTPDANAPNVQMKSGTATLKDKKFSKLRIEPVESIRIMSQGSFGIGSFYVPDKHRMVQVSGQPPAEGGEGWAWADNIQKFSLTAGSGEIYRPAGAWAKVKQQGADRMAASYDSSGASVDVPHSGGEGRPTDVWIAFIVPEGMQLKQLMYDNKPIRDVNLTVK